MKIRLLRKLRNRVANEITIYSVTRTNGDITGMSYGYSDEYYRGLFSFGDTVEDVLHKAWVRYLENNIYSIRKKYRKHSRQYKTTKPN